MQRKFKLNGLYAAILLSMHLNTAHAGELLTEEEVDIHVEQEEVYMTTPQVDGASAGEASRVGVDTLIQRDLPYFINNYRIWSRQEAEVQWRKKLNIPYGGLNDKAVGGGGNNRMLVLSESLSYGLFSLILMADLTTDATDLATIRKAFADYWTWAKENMQRKSPNLSVAQLTFTECDPAPCVKSLTSRTMPPHMRDNLLAWRWLYDIDVDGLGTTPGIVYQTEMPEGESWHDGSQVASDGDVLTAYALLRAHELGWGEVYRTDALNMVADLRNRAVISFTAGEMFNAVKAKAYMAPGQSDPRGAVDNLVAKVIPGADPRSINFLPCGNCIKWEGRNNYLLFWHNPPLDFTAGTGSNQLSTITLEIGGTIGQGAELSFRIQDKGGRTHIVPITNLPAGISTLSLNRVLFENANIDWTQIINLFLQVNKSEDATSLESSTISLKSIKVSLNTGQITSNNGLHLTSNAHGKPAVNPSYFMPFAIKLFAQYDTAYATKWNNLYNRMLIDLDEVRKPGFYLEDNDGNRYWSNGSLIPNWFELDRLTGRMTNVSFQDDADIRGYIYGYDAFRSLWFLAYSHYLDDGNADIKGILCDASAFFADEQANGGINATYAIDGSKPDGNATPLWGMYSVYLDLFRITGRPQKEAAVANLYADYIVSDSDKERAYIEETPWKDDDDDKPTINEIKGYYQNYWSFFGNYLYTKLRQSGKSYTCN